MRNRFNSDEWRRIEKIFHDVADLSEARRQSVLDQLPQRDQALRSEVLSLLNHDSQAAVSSVVVPVESRPVGLSAGTVRKPGQIVGRYRLLFPVAVSQNSHLWCAEFIDDTENALKVAIKFLGDGGGSSRQSDRFENEAHTQARLRHPNVAEFVDCGRDEEGLPFIVTRFVPGESITEFADHNQLSIDERIRLVMKVCDAVEYAHRFLIVHRDLKPSNIIVTKRDEPVVLDFGIAKELSDASEPVSDRLIERNWLTATHERPMTPAYASPEQVRGDSITTSTDVHALGLILYELLSGHHPYSDATHGTIGSLFDRVCQLSAKPPSEVAVLPARCLGQPSDARETTPHTIAGLRGISPAQLKRKLSGSLDNVIGKALQKSPDDRYRSVAELRVDLENVLAGRPVTARRHREWFRDAVRNSPVKATICTAMIATLLVGVVSSVWWIRQLRDLGGKYEIAKAEAASVGKLRGSYDALDASVQRILDRGAAPVKPLELDDSMTMAARLALARQAAEYGKLEDARTLIGSTQNNVVDDADTSSLSLDARLNGAATWVLLGRPSKALELCAGISPEEITRASDPCDATCTLLESYLQAGWVKQAADWESDAGGNKSSPKQARRWLLSAESRLSYGWQDGATDLLTEMQTGRADFAMGSYDATRSELLAAMAAAADASYRTDEGNDSNSPVATKSSQDVEDRIARVIQLARSRFPRLHAEALLLECEQKLRRAEPDSAIESLRDALQTLEEHHLADHVLALRAQRKLASVYATQGKDDEQLEWLRRCWKQVNKLQEFATRDAGQIACDLLQIVGDDHEAIQIIRTMEPTAEFMCHDSYLWSAFAWNAFRVSKQTNDTERLMRYAKSLKVLEPELWGLQSWESAIAHEALSYAQRQSGVTGADRSHLRAVETVQALLTTASPDPATAFLGPFLADSKSVRKRPYDWLRLYLAHRDNNSADQLNMVCYELENAEWIDGEDGSELLASAVRCLKRQTASSKDVEYFARIAKEAANRGAWADVRPVIEDLDESNEESVRRVAAACLVYGQAVTGNSSAALQSTKEEIARTKSTLDDHEPLRLTVWQLSELSRLSQVDRESWKTLLD